MCHIILCTLICLWATNTSPGIDYINIINNDNGNDDKPLLQLQPRGQLQQPQPPQYPSGLRQRPTTRTLGGGRQLVLPFKYYQMFTTRPILNSGTKATRSCRVIYIYSQPSSAKSLQNVASKATLAISGQELWGAGLINPTQTTQLHCKGHCISREKLLEASRRSKQRNGLAADV